MVSQPMLVLPPTTSKTRLVVVVPATGEAVAVGDAVVVCGAVALAASVREGAAPGAEVDALGEGPGDGVSEAAASLVGDGEAGAGEDLSRAALTALPSMRGWLTSETCARTWLTALHAMRTASEVPTIQRAGRDNLLFLMRSNIAKGIT